MEKHLRGASSGEEEAQVQAHLAGCPDCRDFVQRARRIEQELAQATQPEGDVEGRWRQVQALVGKRSRTVRTAWVSALGMALLAVPLALGVGDLPERWDAVAGVLALAAIFSAVALGLRREVRRIHLAPEQELLTWARTTTRKDRRGSLIGALLIGGFALFEVGLLLFGHPDPTSQVLVVAGIVIHGGCLTFCLWRSRVLARELRLLA